jgi:hypothetical protein
MSNTHVIPIGGNEPRHDPKEDCWCFPIFHPDHADLILHNAKDARDAREKRDPELKWTLIRERCKTQQ